MWGLGLLTSLQVVPAVIRTAPQLPMQFHRASSFNFTIKEPKATLIVKAVTFSTSSADCQHPECEHGVLHVGTVMLS